MLLIVMLMLKLPFHHLKLSLHHLAMLFGQLIFGKIIKIAATRGQILRHSFIHSYSFIFSCQNATKHELGDAMTQDCAPNFISAGAPPDPAGGAYSADPMPQPYTSWIEGSLLVRRGWEGIEGKGRGGKNGEI